MEDPEVPRRSPPRPPVRILEGQAGSEAATRAMASYVQELAHRFGTEVSDPGLTVLTDPAEVTPPRGDFLLVREVTSADMVGFGAVRVLRDGVVEIKRMWLRPDARGHGLGRFLLESLENRARALGAERVLIGVNESLVEACGLYRSSGYEQVEPFGDNPHVTHHFGKQLT